jgi:hypothetical protein
MYEALLLTATLYTQSTPTEVRAATPVVNMRAPDKGHYGDIIDEAATVPKKWQPFAKCVLKRETGAALHNKASRADAKNPRSSASGRWQFLQAWQDGGAHMVRERLVRFDLPKTEAKKVRIHLARTPIREWDGYFQDILFNEVIARGGTYHWKGTGCGHGT